MDILSALGIKTETSTCIAMNTCSDFASLVPAEPACLCTYGTSIRPVRYSGFETVLSLAVVFV
jgi:hypothetical protein